MMGNRESESGSVVNHPEQRKKEKQQFVHAIHLVPKWMAEYEPGKRFTAQSDFFAHPVGVVSSDRELAKQIDSAGTDKSQHTLQYDPEIVDATSIWKIAARSRWKVLSVTQRACQCILSGEGMPKVRQFRMLVIAELGNEAKQVAVFYPDLNTTLMMRG